jgi:hypothetical protein
MAKHEERFTMQQTLRAMEQELSAMPKEMNCGKTERPTTRDKADNGKETLDSLIWNLSQKFKSYRHCFI